MIILDTNVISELMRAQPSERVLSWMSEQDGAKLYINSVTAAELHLGVALLPSGKRQGDLAKALEAMLSEDFYGRMLPFDTEAARAYATIVTRRRSLGAPISAFDAQIAAIAAIHNATLATRNTRDFVDCGIALINPWD